MLYARQLETLFLLCDSMEHDTLKRMREKVVCFHRFHIMSELVMTRFVIFCHLTVPLENISVENDRYTPGVPKKISKWDNTTLFDLDNFKALQKHVSVSF